MGKGTGNGDGDGELSLHVAPRRKSPITVKKEEEKKPHIKKPLNAFMLYMKEMRAKVVAECTLKESAAINQILGRRVRASHVPSATFTPPWRCWGPAGGAGCFPGAHSALSPCSGTLCRGRSRPSTTSWHGRSGSCTHSSTPRGRPATTT